LVDMGRDSTASRSEDVNVSTVATPLEGGVGRTECSARNRRNLSSGERANPQPPILREVGDTFAAGRNGEAAIQRDIAERDGSRLAALRAQQEQVAG